MFQEIELFIFLQKMFFLSFGKWNFSAQASNFFLKKNTLENFLKFSQKKGFSLFPDRTF